MTHPPQPGAYGPPVHQQPGYFPQQPHTDPGKRPGVVTTGAMLMLVMTLLSLLTTATLVHTINSLNAASELCQGESACQTDVSGVKIGVIIAALVYLVIGLGLVGLALAILRGRNWARVTTWVGYGVLALGSLTLVRGLFSGMSDIPYSTTAHDDYLVVMVIQLVLETATVILLAVPPANRWFRELGRARILGA